MSNMEKAAALEECLRELSEIRTLTYDDPRSSAWREKTEGTLKDIFGPASVEFHKFIRARDHVYNVLLTREQMQSTFEDKIKSQEAILKGYAKQIRPAKSS